MKLKQLLDQVELLLNAQGYKRAPIERFALLEFAEMALNDILEQVGPNTVKKRLEPAIRTEVGQGSYLLPEDFPENFAYGDDDLEVRNVAQSRFACSYDTSTTSTALVHVTANRFWAEHPSTESNGTPTDYTITTREDGRKLIHLGPKPDAADNSIYGVYTPLYWSITDEDTLVGSSAATSALRYGVLKMVDPTNQSYVQEYSSALRRAHLLAARAKVTRIVVGGI